MRSREREKTAMFLSVRPAVQRAHVVSAEPEVPSRDVEHLSRVRRPNQRRLLRVQTRDPRLDPSRRGAASRRPSSRLIAISEAGRLLHRRLLSADGHDQGPSAPRGLATSRASPRLRTGPGDGEPAPGSCFRCRCAGQRAGSRPRGWLSRRTTSRSAAAEPSLTLTCATAGPGRHDCVVSPPVDDREQRGPRERRVIPDDADEVERSKSTASGTASFRTSAAR